MEKVVYRLHPLHHAMILKRVCYVWTWQEVDRGCFWYCCNLCFIHTQPALNFCVMSHAVSGSCQGKEHWANLWMCTGRRELCPSGLKWLLLSFSCWIMRPERAAFLDLGVLTDLSGLWITHVGSLRLTSVFLSAQILLLWLPLPLSLLPLTGASLPLIEVNFVNGQRPVSLSPPEWNTLHRPHVSSYIETLKCSRKGFFLLFFYLVSGCMWKKSKEGRPKMIVFTAIKSDFKN